MFKNFKGVERCVYGRGAFNQLSDIIAPRRRGKGFVFLVDDVFANGKDGLKDRVPLQQGDKLYWINVDEEPTTWQVDGLRDRILNEFGGTPDGLIGIGGGSVMDIAKATSLMLTNPGKSEQYQGLNLIKIPGVYHLGVPTLAGTAAEVSMTAVLTGPVKKLGLKCDYTFFDQIILDPELIATVPKNQWFYTGMDCYIHCVESLTGTFNNEFSRAYGEKALDMCRIVFLDDNISPADRDDKLMIASYFGGLSLTYSEVGVCHALSYGLSKVLGFRHGYANCVAFYHLEEIYGEAVNEFKTMINKHKIDLPQGQAAGWSEEQISKMADVAYALTHMWRHAFGEDWEKHLTLERIKGWYRLM